MIFRFSAKLGKKLEISPTEVLPTHTNPYADWSAHLAFLPETSSISFSKALNRSVTGSMNELILYAQVILAEEKISLYDVSFKLNDMLLSYIEYVRPREAFEQMKINQ